jgi:hypothetical protein
MNIFPNTIISLTDFVEKIERNCLDGTFLFRGQSQDYPLLPKIARINKFKNSLNMLEAEQKMLKEFKRKSIPMLDRTPQNDWDWLAQMQHHGLATRLLDWTENPLAALWFAVRKPPKNSDPAVVWIFMPKGNDFINSSTDISPFECNSTKVYQPDHISQRIVAQSGWFTVHKYFKDEKVFIPLDNNKLYKKKRIKLTIPTRLFSELRYRLNQCGINSATMFPDLDGLCQQIQWTSAPMADEKPSLDTAVRELTSRLSELKNIRRRHIRRGRIAKITSKPYPLFKLKNNKPTSNT